MFETARVSMLTVALRKVFAHFWLIIVRVVTLISIFAVASFGKLFADLGSHLVRQPTVISGFTKTCSHVFFALLG